MKVIVVTRREAVLKVCESWDAYDEWLENSKWHSYDVTTCEATVYEEKS